MLNIVDIHGSVEGDYDVIATLPHNATNGDVFMSMFPNAIKSNYIESDGQFEDYIEIYLGDYLMRVSVDWWYAQYKR